MISGRISKAVTPVGNGQQRQKPKDFIRVSSSVGTLKPVSSVTRAISSVSCSNKKGTNDDEIYRPEEIGVMCNRITRSFVNKNPTEDTSIKSKKISSPQMVKETNGKATQNVTKSVVPGAEILKPTKSKDEKSKEMTSKTLTCVKMTDNNGTLLQTTKQNSEKLRNINDSINVTSPKPANLTDSKKESSCTYKENFRSSTDTNENEKLDKRTNGPTKSGIKTVTRAYTKSTNSPSFTTANKQANSYVRENKRVEIRREPHLLNKEDTRNTSSRVICNDRLTKEHVKSKTHKQSKYLKPEKSSGSIKTYIDKANGHRKTVYTPEKSRSTTPCSGTSSLSESMSLSSTSSGNKKHTPKTVLKRENGISSKSNENTHVNMYLDSVKQSQSVIRKASDDTAGSENAVKIHSRSKGKLKPNITRLNSQCNYTKTKSNTANMQANKNGRQNEQPLVQTSAVNIQKSTTNASGRFRKANNAKGINSLIKSGPNRETLLPEDQIKKPKRIMSVNNNHLSKSPEPCHLGKSDKLVKKPIAPTQKSSQAKCPSSNELVTVSVERTNTITDTNSIENDTRSKEGEVTYHTGRSVACSPAMAEKRKYERGRRIFINDNHLPCSRQKHENNLLKKPASDKSDKLKSSVLKQPKYSLSNEKDFESNRHDSKRISDSQKIKLKVRQESESVTDILSRVPKSKSRQNRNHKTTPSQLLSSDSEQKEINCFTKQKRSKQQTDKSRHIPHRSGSSAVTAKNTFSSSLSDDISVPYENNKFLIKSLPIEIVKNNKIDVRKDFSSSRRERLYNQIPSKARDLSGTSNVHSANEDDSYRHMHSAVKEKNTCTFCRLQEQNSSECSVQMGDKTAYLSEELSNMSDLGHGLLPEKDVCSEPLSISDSDSGVQPNERLSSRKCNYFKQSSDSDSVLTRLEKFGYCDICVSSICEHVRTCEITDQNIKLHVDKNMLNQLQTNDVSSESKSKETDVPIFMENIQNQKVHYTYDVEKEKSLCANCTKGGQNRLEQTSFSWPHSLCSLTQTYKQSTEGTDNYCRVLNKHYLGKVISCTSRASSENESLFSKEFEIKNNPLQMNNKFILSNASYISCERFQEKCTCTKGNSEILDLLSTSDIKLAGNRHLRNVTYGKINLDDNIFSSLAIWKTKAGEFVEKSFEMDGFIPGVGIIARMTSYQCSKMKCKKKDEVLSDKISYATCTRPSKDLNQICRANDKMCNTETSAQNKSINWEFRDKKMENSYSNLSTNTSCSESDLAKFNSDASEISRSVLRNNSTGEELLSEEYLDVQCLKTQQECCLQLLGAESKRQLLEVEDGFREDWPVETCSPPAVSANICEEISPESFVNLLKMDTDVCRQIQPYEHHHCGMTGDLGDGNTVYSPPDSPMKQLSKESKENGLLSADESCTELKIPSPELAVVKECFFETCETQVMSQKYDLVDGRKGYQIQVVNNFIDRNSSEDRTCVGRTSVAGLSVLGVSVSQNNIRNSIVPNEITDSYQEEADLLLYNSSGNDCVVKPKNGTDEVFGYVSHANLALNVSFLNFDGQGNVPFTRSLSLPDLPIAAKKRRNSDGNIGKIFAGDATDCFTSTLQSTCTKSTSRTYRNNFHVLSLKELCCECIKQFQPLCVNLTSNQQLEANICPPENECVSNTQQFSSSIQSSYDASSEASKITLKPHITNDHIRSNKRSSDISGLPEGYDSCSDNYSHVGSIMVSAGKTRNRSVQVLNHENMELTKVTNSFYGKNSCLDVSQSGQVNPFDKKEPEGGGLTCALSQKDENKDSGYFSNEQGQDDISTRLTDGTTRILYDNDLRIARLLSPECWSPCRNNLSHNNDLTEISPESPHAIQKEPTTELCKGERVVSMCEVDRESCSHKNEISQKIQGPEPCPVIHSIYQHREIADGGVIFQNEAEALAGTKSFRNGQTQSSIMTELCTSDVETTVNKSPSDSFLTDSKDSNNEDLQDFSSYDAQLRPSSCDACIGRKHANEKSESTFNICVKENDKSHISLLDSQGVTLKNLLKDSVPQDRAVCGQSNQIKEDMDSEDLKETSKFSDKNYSLSCTHEINRCQECFKNSHTSEKFNKFGQLIKVKSLHASKECLCIQQDYCDRVFDLCSEIVLPEDISCRKVSSQTSNVCYKSSLSISDTLKDNTPDEQSTGLISKNRIEFKHQQSGTEIHHSQQIDKKKFTKKSYLSGNALSISNGEGCESSCDPILGFLENNILDSDGKNVEKYLVNNKNDDSFDAFCGSRDYSGLAVASSCSGFSSNVRERIYNESKSLKETVTVSSQQTRAAEDRDICRDNTLNSTEYTKCLCCNSGVNLLNKAGVHSNISQCVNLSNVSTYGSLQHQTVVEPNLNLSKNKLSPEINISDDCQFCFLTKSFHVPINENKSACSHCSENSQEVVTQGIKHENTYLYTLHEKQSQRPTKLKGHCEPHISNTDYSASHSVVYEGGESLCDYVYDDVYLNETYDTFVDAEDSLFESDVEDSRSDEKQTSILYTGSDKSTSVDSFKDAIEFIDDVCDDEDDSYDETINFSNAASVRLSDGTYDNSEDCLRFGENLAFGCGLSTQTTNIPLTKIKTESFETSENTRSSGNLYPDFAISGNTDNSPQISTAKCLSNDSLYSKRFEDSLIHHDRISDRSAINTSDIACRNSCMYSEMSSAIPRNDASTSQKGETGRDVCRVQTTRNLARTRYEELMKDRNQSSVQAPAANVRSRSGNRVLHSVNILESKEKSCSLALAGSKIETAATIRNEKRRLRQINKQASITSISSADSDVSNHACDAVSESANIKDSSENERNCLSTRDDKALMLTLSPSDDRVTDVRKFSYTKHPLNGSENGTLTISQSCDVSKKPNDTVIFELLETVSKDHSKENNRKPVNQLSESTVCIDSHRIPFGTDCCTVPESVDTFEVNNLGNYFDGALHSNNQKSIGDQSPFNLQTSTILISSECLETETQSVSDINSCKDPQKEYQTTPFSDMNKTAGNYSQLESNKLLSSDIFCARLPNDKLVDHNNVDSKLQQQHHSCDTVSASYQTIPLDLAKRNTDHSAQESVVVSKYTEVEPRALVEDDLFVFSTDESLIAKTAEEGPQEYHAFESTADDRKIPCLNAVQTTQQSECTACSVTDSGSLVSPSTLETTNTVIQFVPLSVLPGIEDGIIQMSAATNILRIASGTSTESLLAEVQVSCVSTINNSSPNDSTHIDSNTTKMNTISETTCEDVAGDRTQIPAPQPTFRDIPMSSESMAQISTASDIFGPPDISSYLYCVNVCEDKDNIPQVGRLDKCGFELADLQTFSANDTCELPLVIPPKKDFSETFDSNEISIMESQKFSEIDCNQNCMSSGNIEKEIVCVSINRNKDVIYRSSENVSFIRSHNQDTDLCIQAHGVRSDKTGESLQLNENRLSSSEFRLSNKEDRELSYDLKWQDVNSDCRPSKNDDGRRKHSDNSECSCFNHEHLQENLRNSEVFSTEHALDVRSQRGRNDENSETALYVVGGAEISFEVDIADSNVRNQLTKNTDLQFNERQRTGIAQSNGDDLSVNILSQNSLNLESSFCSANRPQADTDLGSNSTFSINIGVDIKTDLSKIKPEVCKTENSCFSQISDKTTTEESSLNSCHNKVNGNKFEDSITSQNPIIGNQDNLLVSCKESNIVTKQNNNALETGSSVVRASSPIKALKVNASDRTDYRSIYQNLEKSGKPGCIESIHLTEGELRQEANMRQINCINDLPSVNSANSDAEICEDSNISVAMALKREKEKLKEASSLNYGRKPGSRCFRRATTAIILQNRERKLQKQENESCNNTELELSSKIRKSKSFHVDNKSEHRTLGNTSVMENDKRNNKDENIFISKKVSDICKSFIEKTQASIAEKQTLRKLSPAVSPLPQRKLMNWVFREGKWIREPLICDSASGSVKNSHGMIGVSPDKISTGSDKPKIIANTVDDCHQASLYSEVHENSSSGGNVETATVVRPNSERINKHGHAGTEKETKEKTVHETFRTLSNTQDTVTSEKSTLTENVEMLGLKMETLDGIKSLATASTLSKDHKRDSKQKFSNKDRTDDILLLIMGEDIEYIDGVDHVQTDPSDSNDSISSGENETLQTENMETDSMTTTDTFDESESASKMCNDNHSYFEQGRMKTHDKTSLICKPLESFNESTQPSGTKTDTVKGIVSIVNEDVDSGKIKDFVQPSTLADICQKSLSLSTEGVHLKPRHSESNSYAEINSGAVIVMPLQRNIQTNDGTNLADTAGDRRDECENWAMSKHNLPDMCRFNTKKKTVVPSPSKLPCTSGNPGAKQSHSMTETIIQQTSENNNTDVKEVQNKDTVLIIDPTVSNAPKQIPKLKAVKIKEEEIFEGKPEYTKECNLHPLGIENGENPSTVSELNVRSKQAVEKDLKNMDSVNVSSKRNTPVKLTNKKLLTKSKTFSELQNLRKHTDIIKDSVNDGKLNSYSNALDKSAENRLSKIPKPHSYAKTTSKTTNVDGLRHEKKCDGIHNQFYRESGGPNNNFDSENTRKLTRTISLPDTRLLCGKRPDHVKSETNMNIMADSSNFKICNSEQGVQIDVKVDTTKGQTPRLKCEANEKRYERSMSLQRPKLLSEIAEVEESRDDQLQTRNNKGPSSSPCGGPPLEPRVKRPVRRPHKRRSLSLPTGTLAFGEARIVYRNGHFTIETMDGTELDSSGLTSHQSYYISSQQQSIDQKTSYNKGHQTSLRMLPEPQPSLPREITSERPHLRRQVGKTVLTRNELIDKGEVFENIENVSPSQKFSKQHNLPLSRMCSKEKGDYLLRFRNKSEQSLNQSTESLSYSEQMDLDQDNDSLGEMQVHYLSSSSLPDTASEEVKHVVQRARRTSSFRQAQEQGAFRLSGIEEDQDHEISRRRTLSLEERQNTDLNQSRMSQTSNQNTSFFQRMMAKRKTSMENFNLSSFAKQSESAKDFFSKKMSLKGLFRKNRSDSTVNSPLRTQFSSSPPVSVFSHNEDQDLLGSTPSSPLRGKDMRRRHTSADLFSKAFKDATPSLHTNSNSSTPTGDKEVFLRSNSTPGMEANFIVRTPSRTPSSSSMSKSSTTIDEDQISIKSTSSTTSSIHSVHTQPLEQPDKPKTPKPVGTSPRRFPSGGSQGSHNSKIFIYRDRDRDATLSITSLESESSEIVFEDYSDMKCDCESLTPTLTRAYKSTNKTDISMLPLRCELCGKYTAEFFNHPQKAKKFTIGPDSLVDHERLQKDSTGRLALLAKNEISASNSNDSGIQHDVSVHSSSESLKGTPESKVRFRRQKSTSPRPDRPKSEIGVRWADLDTQEYDVGSTPIRRRERSQNIKDRPRPKSDFEDNIQLFDELFIEVLEDFETDGSSFFSDRMKAFGSEINLQPYCSLRNLYEMRRRDWENSQGKNRRMSTPHPIKSRLQRTPKRLQKQAPLVRSSSMPESLDKVHKRRKLHHLLDFHEASLSKHMDLDECLSDDSDLSFDHISLQEKSLSVQSSQSQLTSMDEEDDSLTYAEALWDHITMDPEELGFRAGDLIDVFDMSDKDWWFGELEDREGWFPAAFVRLRVNQDQFEEELEVTLQPELSTSPKLRRISTINKDQARTNVVNEIISAEREYVKHLKDVVEGYIQHARKRHEMFPEERLSCIFGNIENIYTFAQKFLSQLEMCIDVCPHLSEIGQCFLDNEKGFEIYSDYCNNHPSACEELKELYRNAKYRHFFEACRLLQELVEIPLEGFLLTPVQKICKYPLQLAELLKYTPPEHADYLKVKAALHEMRKIATLINERKRKMESIEKIAAWQHTVADWEGEDLLERSSELIFSGDINKINSAGWSQERYFFLFDHQLIYCKKELLKRHVFSYKGRIDLDHCDIIPLSDGKDTQYNVTVKHAWKLHETHKNKWYLLYTKSSTGKDRWLKALADERKRVREDQENDFCVPEHWKQTVLNKVRSQTTLKEKQHSHRPTPDSHIMLQKDFSSSVPYATLPRVKRATSQKQEKKKGWFNFGGKKSKR